MSGRKRYHIGIDGSTTSTGIAVFDKDGEYVTHTCITRKRNQAVEKHLDMDIRVQEMMLRLLEFFKEYPPASVTIEDSYGGKDMYAYKKLCHLQGFVAGCCVMKKIPLEFVTPAVWRKAVGIPSVVNKKRLKRDELKLQAIHLVQEKLGISVTDDEADAICIGWYHFISLNKR